MQKQKKLPPHTSESSFYLIFSFVSSTDGYFRHRLFLYGIQRYRSVFDTLEINLVQVNAADRCIVHGTEINHPMTHVRSRRPLGGLDPQTITRYLPLLQELTRDTSQTTQLLYALRPFLKDGKQNKVERAARLARLITIGKRFLTEGGGLPV